MVFRHGGSVGGCDADGVTNSDLTSIVQTVDIQCGNVCPAMWWMWDGGAVCMCR